jgi:hypothetical protein
MDDMLQSWAENPEITERTLVKLSELENAQRSLNVMGSIWAKKKKKKKKPSESSRITF